MSVIFMGIMIGLLKIFHNTISHITAALNFYVKISHQLFSLRILFKCK